jgi:hypothetical protein
LLLFLVPDLLFCAKHLIVAALWPHWQFLHLAAGAAALPAVSRSCCRAPGGARAAFHEPWRGTRQLSQADHVAGRSPFNEPGQVPCHGGHDAPVFFTITVAVVDVGHRAGLVIGDPVHRIAAKAEAGDRGQAGAAWEGTPRMKNALIIVLAVLTVFLADRMVRIENQRYASLLLGACIAEGITLPEGRTECLAECPRVKAAQTPSTVYISWGVAFTNCVYDRQTRTSWFWHFYYAVSDHVPAVPLFNPH